MDLLHAKLHALLQHWGIAPQATGWVEQLLLLAAILLAAYTADFICRRFFVEGIRRITRRTKATWDDILFNDRVLNHLCHIIPPIIIYALLPVAFPNQAGLLSFLLRICMIYIIAVVLRFVNVFLQIDAEYAEICQLLCLRIGYIFLYQWHTAELNQHFRRAELHAVHVNVYEPLDAPSSAFAHATPVLE